MTSLMSRIKMKSKVTGNIKYRYRLQIRDLLSSTSYKLRVRGVPLVDLHGSAGVKPSPYTSTFSFCTKSTDSPSAKEFSAQALKIMTWQPHPQLVYLDNSSALIHVESTQRLPLVEYHHNLGK